jgi:aspartyl-tRNA(Asn)/glutamyl-tRNA(Gln) amidotransferase subunit B
MDYEAVIGLEVHAQLSTKTKIWCGCELDTSAHANKKTCPVCMGMPGVLPVLNKQVVEYATRFGLAVEADVRKYSEFSRKNYFYQDLPLGYQITQYEHPIVENGILDVDVGDVGEEKYQIKVRITRAHIENDTGKSIHDEAITGADVSYVDFNRAGTPLLEIVTEPDIRSGKEANFYLQQLRQVLRFLEISDGNLEDGSFRCDANVSIRPKGQKEYGTRTEVKNMNSFKNVERAINYEIERHKAVLATGEKIVQETRMWNAAEGKTISMRSKEDAMDYRYFPEPDLIPLKITDEFIENVSKTLPELPHKRRERFMKEYELPFDDANILTTNREIASYYEDVVRFSDETKLSANWILSEALREVNERAISISEFQIQPDRLAELIILIKSKTISGKIGKKVFEIMLDSDDSPKKIVEKQGLLQITDESVLKPLCEEVLAKNEKLVQDYLGGRDKVFGAFVGQLMKATKGKANPELVNNIFKSLLEERK